MRNSPSVPPVVAAAAFLGGLLLAVPLVGLLLNVPARSLINLLASSETLSAIRVSLLVSLSAAAISIVLGVPIAFVLARTEFWGKTLVRTLVTVPLVLPPVVTGVALIYGFGQRGLLSQTLGIALSNTTAGAIIAATTVAMPFLVLSVEGSLRNLDPRYEQVAASLESSPFQRWWRISLPLARPSIVAGTVLAWARALGEFGATITFAGNIPEVTRTLPLEVSIAFEQDQQRAIALSVLLLTISLGVLVSLRNRWIPNR